MRSRVSPEEIPLLTWPSTKFEKAACVKNASCSGRWEVLGVDWLSKVVHGMFPGGFRRV